LRDTSTITLPPRFIVIRYSLGGDTDNSNTAWVRTLEYILVGVFEESNSDALPVVLYLVRIDVGYNNCKERSSTNLRHSPAFPAIKQALLPLFQNRT